MAKKNYKKYKEKYNKKSKGVGDTVEKITTATGIKKQLNLQQVMIVDVMKEKIN